MTNNPAVQGQLAVERVDTLAGLDALAPDWQRLQAGCDSKHVMLDFRWFRTWFEIFGGDKQLCVLVVVHDGEKVAIAPLILSSGYELFPARKYQVHLAEEYQFTKVPKYLRWVPVTRLSFALSGALANRRAHFLMSAPRLEYFKVLLAYIESMAADWDLFCVEGLENGGEQERLLLTALTESNLASDGRQFSRKTEFAELPETMDDYLAGKRRHFRRRLKEQCRAVAKQYPDLQIKTYRQAEVAAGVERLLALEEQSWKVLEQRNRTFHIGPTPQLQAFHRQVAQAFAADDGAVVISMESDGETLAAILGLERDRRLATIVTFMNAALPARFNTAPMFRHMIESSIQRGVKEIDFCGSTANIAKWASAVRYCNRHFIYNSRPYSRMLRCTAVGANRLVRLVTGWRAALTASRVEVAS